MTSVTVLYVLCVLLLAASVAVFAYTALCIFKWKVDIDAQIENLETSVNALRIETKHTSRLVEINDEAVDKFGETNKKILELNDDLIKSNHELTDALSNILARREENDISEA